MLLNEDEAVTARDGTGRRQRRRWDSRDTRGDETRRTGETTASDEWCSGPTMAVVNGCYGGGCGDGCGSPTMRGRSESYRRPPDGLKSRAHKGFEREEAAAAAAAGATDTAATDGIARERRRSSSDGARRGASDRGSTLPVRRRRRSGDSGGGGSESSDAEPDGLNVDTWIRTTTVPGRRDDGPDSGNGRGRHHRRHKNVRRTPRTRIYSDWRGNVSADT